MERIDRFIRKNQGSISLLLAIILLPTLLFSGLIIDIANRQMSKAMVESAGELAVSSALANYDSVLEDVYGLFAMSQNYDDLKDNVSQYMRDTLSAQGLLEGVDYGSDLINGAMGLLDEEVGELGHNFINASVEVTTAEGLSSSALSKPEIMKSQIVEYMKYRGVQVAAQDLLSTLKQFQGLGEKEKVAEDKMDVAEKQEDLSDAAQAFYKEIVNLDEYLQKVEDEYAKLQNPDRWGVTSEYWADFTSGQIQYVEFYTANSVYTHLWTANANIVTAADAVELDDDSLYYISTNGYINSTGTAYTDLPLYVVRNIRSYNDIKSPGWITINNCERTANTLLGLYNNLITQRDALLSIGRDYYEFYTETIDGIAVQNYRPIASAYNTYNWFIDYAAQYTGYLSKINTFVNELEANTERTEEEEQELTDWRNLLVDFTVSFKNIIESMEYYGSTQLIEYIDNDTGTYSFIADWYLEKMETAKEKAGHELKEAHKIIKPYYDSIKNALEAEALTNWWQKLTGNGENYFDYVIELGVTVQNNIIAVNEANGRYRDSIDTYGSEVGEDEYYAQTDSEQKANDATYSVDDVQEVLDQLIAIREFLTNEKETLDDSSLYEKAFELDKDYASERDKSLGSGFINAAKGFVRSAKSVPGNQDLMNLYRYTFRNYVKVKMSNTAYTTDAYVKRINELLRIGDQSVPVPKFYLYLVQTYGYEQGSGGTSESSNMETASNQSPADPDTGSVQGSSGTFSDLTLSSTTAEDGTELTDDQKGSGRSKLLTQFKAYGELFRGIIDACANLTDPEQIRDDLLVTTYIYENFSNYIDTKNQEERHTLSVVPINKNNNALFGCEQEFILYGNTENPQDNIGVVKGNIFAIRFISNSIFAICDSTINAYTLSPALAIQAATMGIFPYKVAQVVLDLILALAETVYDMNKIMNGEKVPLFKNIKNWVCQPSGVAKILSEAAVDAIEYGAEQLTDYLQELVNNKAKATEDWITNAAQGMTNSAASTLTSYLQEAISSLSQVIANELTTLINKVYSGQAVSLDEGSVKRTIKQALRSYITGAAGGDNPSISQEVKQFLLNHADEMVDKVMSTRVTVSGQTFSIDEVLQKVQEEYQALLSTGETGTIEVNASYFENMLSGVSESLKAYIDEIKEEIDETVETWVSEFSNKITTTLNGYIEEGVDTLSSAAAESVSSFINTEVEKYFPAESELNFETEGTASGGSLGDMFNFGYTDYLRLFLFLGVSNENKENAMLQRIGDVITINRVKGLKDYYTANQITAASGNSGDAAGYSLTRAYTYLIVSAKVTVKPTILGSGWFSEDGRPLSQASNTMTASSFWTYQFATTGGY